MTPSRRSCEAADVVDDRERRDVVEERVDREVAAERVLFRRAERVVVANHADPPARRRRSALGGRRLVLGARQARCRRNVATSIVLLPKRTCASRKRRPMIQQFRNSFLIWYGMRVGADVEVLRLAAEQQVADAAADEVRGVVELLQAVQNLERVRIDVPARNRVFRARDDHRLRHPRCAL